MRQGPIFIAGGPGAGKTSLADALSRVLRWPVLYSREAVQAVDPDSIKEGRLGSRGPVLVALAQKVTEYSTTYGTDYIVDGAPRTPDQIAIVPDGAEVLLLRCDPAVALLRLRNRGRDDDTEDLASKRVLEQYGQDDQWLRDLAGWTRTINTTKRTKGSVLDTVMLYLTGERREIF